MAVDNNPPECGIWDREGSCLIALALLDTLPAYHRKTIPSDYLDMMGHMNIRWYFDLFANDINRRQTQTINYFCLADQPRQKNFCVREPLSSERSKQAVR
jgi:hypothetical protein